MPLLLGRVYFAHHVCAAQEAQDAFVETNSRACAPGELTRSRHLESAKGGGRTPKSIQEPIAPHSVLRYFFKEKRGRGCRRLVLASRSASVQLRPAQRGGNGWRDASGVS